MAIDYLKRAAKTPETETAAARRVVEEMLAEIRERGEQAVREYAQKLDRWSGPIGGTSEEVERRTRSIPPGIRKDIEFATAQVQRFAQAQRDSMQEFSLELSKGL